MMDNTIALADKGLSCDRIVSIPQRCLDDVGYRSSMANRILQMRDSDGFSFDCAVSVSETDLGDDGYQFGMADSLHGSVVGHLTN